MRRKLQRCQFVRGKKHNSRALYFVKMVLVFFEGYALQIKMYWVSVQIKVNSQWFLSVLMPTMPRAPLYAVPI
jgi:hypothetical protein